MLFGTIAALYLAREILIPLAFAITLTFVLTPWSRSCKDHASAAYRPSL